MATAISMVTRAMRLARVISRSEVPDDPESADGLAAMNTMLESWSIEPLFVYYIVEESLTLVANQATYTMGSGGNLNTTRPTRIEDSCFIRDSGFDYPLTLIDDGQYASICAKSTATSNVPEYLFADMQYPLVRLNFYPVPSSANVAHIKSWKQLQQFTSLTDVLALPPGYQRAIEYSLAEEFGVEFGKKISPKVEQIALKARANIKRINAPSRIMSSDVGLMNLTRTTGSIYSG